MADIIGDRLMSQKGKGQLAHEFSYLVAYVSSYLGC